MVRKTAIGNSIGIALLGSSCIQGFNLLRRSSNLEGLPNHENLALAEEPPPKYFGLQLVGIQVLGLESQPRTPFDPNSRCLQAGVPVTSLDGIPVSFEKCQSVDLGMLNVDTEVRERQQWYFDKKGSFHSRKYEGRCLRRTLCRDQFVYDLGACDDENVAVFQVAIDSGNTVKNIGRPLQALAHDGNECKICGAYRVTQFCKDGKVQGSGLCMYDSDKEKQVGWTNQRSQFIPPAGRDYNVESGLSAIGGKQRDLYDVFFNFESPNHLSKTFMGFSSNGMKPLVKEVCHSRVADGPDETSYFYFKQFDH